MDWRERIEQKIKQLEQEMAAFVEQANQQIAAQQGGIEALRQLLADDAAAVTDAAVGEPTVEPPLERTVFAVFDGIDTATDTAVDGQDAG